jgi:hypothetical protein
VNGRLQATPAVSGGVGRPGFRRIGDLVGSGACLDAVVMRDQEELVSSPETGIAFQQQHSGSSLSRLF